ncbi:putative ribonuclease H-like domain-containing protein [Tanacetum coccineum]
MRPFVCPVTILNTIDHLGKFDSKAEEGFFVGYSLNSKAFRVFNSRTRIVEENLHIRYTVLMVLPGGLRDDKNDGAVADINNFGYKSKFSPIQLQEFIKCILFIMIGDFQSTSTNKKMIKNLGNMENPKGNSKYIEVTKLDKAMTEEHHNSSIRSLDIRGFTKWKKGLYALMDFVVYQMDVKSVFLYGKIEEEVYVCQPLGFEDPDFPDRVYKVEKALYGLHQAPRAWYETLSTYLLDNGFQRGKIDKNLLIKRHKVKQKKDGIFISQDKYIEEILKKFWFTKVKTASTPMETQKPLLKDKDVCACARYQVNPKVSHLHVVKRIFSARNNSVAIPQQKLKYVAAIQFVPQPSDPSENVADEAVYKELGDSLVRAATTTSSLETEQDSGNITKTRSKATPNKSSSLGTTSGGGPRCQETMGDTIAQTRFENVSKHSNDSLLAREDKDHSSNEIASLKRRVKKLEKKNRSRTHRLKRLYKFGLTARVESSDNEESLGEDASKQGRIDAINADKEITLVNVQNVDGEMFDVNVLDGEEVFVADKEVNNEVNVVEEVVEVINSAKLIIDVAQVSAAGDIVSTASAATTVSAATTTTDDVDDVTLAQAFTEMKSTKPKMKVVIIQELGESTTKISSQQSQDKGKGIMIEPVKPMKKKDQISFDEETALKAGGAKEKKQNRAIQENTKKQKVEEDKETTELKQLMKIIPYEEDVAIDAIPLAVKSLNIIDWKIHKEGRKSYYQIIKADGKSQMYMFFSQMLKNFDREDLEDLYKLVKAKFESTKLVEDLDLLLWGNLKTMFEPHVQDAIYMLVEKKYPLTPLTLSMMLEKKLNIDYESEMAYQLLKLIIKQLKK